MWKLQGPCLLRVWWELRGGNALHLLSLVQVLSSAGLLGGLPMHTAVLLNTSHSLIKMMSSSEVTLLLLRCLPLLTGVHFLILTPIFSG